MKPNYYQADAFALYQPPSEPGEEKEPRRVPVKVECFDLIEALKFGFNLGNVLKYLWRAGHKTSEPRINDLLKAKTYLEREIQAQLDRDNEDLPF